jgi:hypothetical protein
MPMSSEKMKDKIGEYMKHSAIGYPATEVSSITFKKNFVYMMLN